ncbi:MAG: lysophospholipid acyltransferase family protein [Hyphomicrobium sp.]|nr:lysophospholipid acyltransferase family protein [Hyphomicrobium sp.]
MLRSILFAIAFYVVTALYLILLSWLLLAPRSWAMAGLKFHSRTVVWLLDMILGLRMEVRGQDKLPAGPALIVAKHQSAWDTIALIPLFGDVAIVMKDELKWIPLYGWFCVKFAHILVKRDRAAAALKTMVADAKARVADGREVLIFPEGTRQAPGAAPDYKPGYLALYDALGVPLVPMALNSGLFWPRRRMARYPGTVVVEFLDPVPPGEPRKAVKVKVEAAIEAATARLVAEALSGPNAPPTPAARSEHK